MSTANATVGWVNLAVFVLLAGAAVREWRLRGGRAAFWAAFAFLALGLVEVAARIIPAHRTNVGEDIAVRVEILVLVLFPYLLYRFTTAFDRPTRALERRLGLMTVAIAVWTCALPGVPETGQPQPWWFTAYVVAFVAHWTILSTIAAARLWRAGRRQPGVARRRMELLSAGTVAIVVALFLTAVSPGNESRLTLAAALLGLLSAIAFLLGVAPPSTLRLVWRVPEQERVQTAIAELMTATSEQEVAERVLAPMADIVGARTLVLRDADDAPLGRFERLPESFGGQPVRIEMPSGSLEVWTSPYAPFFGRDEMRLLETLAALTGLALDRTRLFTREREAREALERADELKSTFIALAAHELRTPVTVIHGILETVARAGDLLSGDQRAELDEALVIQAERMRSLVEQLLDLSRLEAEAVPIQPQRFRVRDRVGEVVASVTGPAGRDADGIEIDVPSGLEAVADVHAFDRILSNLVVNALRYGRKPIRITAEHSDSHFRLAVEDRGRGVPADFVPELFERFTRSEPSRGTPGGTGLGLAIARSYARAHRGELLYEAARPHGASFQLVLPAW